MSAPYRTLFTGRLVQESGLSVGGADPAVSLVDSPLCRDGRGAYVLRGQSLAGALIATARKVAGKLPGDVGGRGFKGEEAMPSRWQVFASHPEGDPQSEFRQHVGVRQDTGAAAKGVLYDVEVLPRGTCWPFLLEVNTKGEGGGAAERLAAAALLEWTRGRCWVGRDVARGLGWLRLQNLQARRLYATHALSWPDSREEPWKVIEKLECTPIDVSQFATDFVPLPVSATWQYIEVEGTVRAGMHDDDGYGLDALSIGGHATASLFAPLSEHFLRPKGFQKDAFEANFEPDHAFVMTRRADGTLKPLLSGSSLRGPLRHALSRALRRRGAIVRDPNCDQGNKAPKADLASALFGSLKRSASLLVRDAHLVNGDWTAAWLQHHAEDEFSGGVYSSGKFDRAVLVEGCFAWRMVVEYRHRFFDKHLGAIRDAFVNFAKAGHLPLGGAKWRSAGWPVWNIKAMRFGRAGEDARDL